VAMYFQARGEGQLVDAVLGWPRQAPGGPPAYSAPAAPYGTAPVPPAPYGAPPAPPPADQGQAYAPARPPLAAPDQPAEVSPDADLPQDRTAVTQPSAPEAPAQPAMPEPPPPPQPPASGLGA
jgi:hypothetical protein